MERRMAVLKREYRNFGEAQTRYQLRDVPIWRGATSTVQRVNSSTARIAMYEASGISNAARDAGADRQVERPVHVVQDW